VTVGAGGGGGGGVVTVKSPFEVAVPPGVVTVTLPLVAFCGTAASTREDETTLNRADVPPIVTLVAPLRFEPVIVIVAPGCPEVGENEAI
jgi:hypothetical protein